MSASSMHSVNLFLQLSNLLFVTLPSCGLIGSLRGFITDYGVPLLVLVWTAVSYIPVNKVPKGIPRRLFSPNPWSPGAYSNWTVIKVILKFKVHIFI